MSALKTVYIGIKDESGLTNRKEARDYQAKAYNDFMSIISSTLAIPNINIETIVDLQIKFNYPDNIIFNLKKFDHTDLFNDCCLMETETNDTYIVSNNLTQLDFLILQSNGRLGRLTSPEGFVKPEGFTEPEGSVKPSGFGGKRTYYKRKSFKKNK